MKYFRFFIIGFTIILAVQFGMLVFLEKVYFADSAVYTSTRVENLSSKEKPNLKINLEEGITNTSASYNGDYFAYLKNGNLYVLNLWNADKTEVSASAGSEIVYYKWIYDRNRLILAERPISFKRRQSFKLYYYDVDNNSKVEILNEVNNKNIRIPISSVHENIDTIEMSTLTNVIYVKLSNDNNRSRIYRINIMAEEKSISTLTHNIGRIVSTKRDDVLLYENLNENDVYKSGEYRPLQIEGNTNLKLLGVDENDNVYLALSENGQTQRLYYGNLASENWKSVDLDEPIDINSIYVNINGKIYIYSSAGSTLKELKSGKEFTYNGNIVGRYGGGIILEKDGQINDQVLN